LYGDKTQISGTGSAEVGFLLGLSELLATQGSGEHYYAYISSTYQVQVDDTWRTSGLEWSSSSATATGQTNSSFQHQSLPQNIPNLPRHLHNSLAHFHCSHNRVAMLNRDACFAHLAIHWRNRDLSDLVEGDLKLRVKLLSSPVIVAAQRKQIELC
jgi:hypothetical protein